MPAGSSSLRGALTAKMVAMPGSVLRANSTAGRPQCLFALFFLSAHLRVANSKCLPLLDSWGKHPFLVAPGFPGVAKTPVRGDKSPCVSAGILSHFMQQCSAVIPYRLLRRGYGGEVGWVTHLGRSGVETLVKRERGYKEVRVSFAWCSKKASTRREVN